LYFSVLAAHIYVCEQALYADIDIFICFNGILNMPVVYTMFTPYYG